MTLLGSFSNTTIKGSITAQAAPARDLTQSLLYFLHLPVALLLTENGLCLSQHETPPVQRINWELESKQAMALTQNLRLKTARGISASSQQHIPTSCHSGFFLLSSRLSLGGIPCLKSELILRCLKPCTISTASIRVHMLPFSTAAQVALNHENPV